MCTTPSPDLKQAVIDLGYAGERDVWVAVSGGHSNQVWDVRTAKGRIIVKSFPRNWSNPLFGNACDLEFYALGVLEPFNIAPEPLAIGSTAKSEFLIYKRLRQVEPLMKAREAGGVLRRVHDVWDNGDSPIDVPNLKNPVTELLDQNLPLPEAVMEF